jgi:hypothetical protein
MSWWSKRRESKEKYEKLDKLSVINTKLAKYRKTLFMLNRVKRGNSKYALLVREAICLLLSEKYALEAELKQFSGIDE